jgi:hypothetical protein
LTATSLLQKGVCAQHPDVGCLPHKDGRYTCPKCLGEAWGLLRNTIREFCGVLTKASNEMEEQASQLETAVGALGVHEDVDDGPLYVGTEEQRAELRKAFAEYPELTNRDKHQIAVAMRKCQMRNVRRVVAAYLEGKREKAKVDGEASRV